jgi:hypothetical protein
VRNAAGRLGYIKRWGEAKMPEDAAARLKKACDDAYDKFPKYCNQSTHSVICSLVDSKWPLELADDMIDRLVQAGWKPVSTDDAWKAAGEGMVVVAGLKGGGHGHVLVVYPGPKKPKNGFDCNGKYYPPSGDPLPLAMSTSVSAWCGTRSKGDKTVADAWSAGDWANVVLWRQP